MSDRPKLIVFSGLPGVGKSTLAERVARKFQAVWLRVDVLEASMLQAGLPHSFETGLAAYLGCHDVAREQLRLGRNVVVDAVNGVEPPRRMWRELSDESPADRSTIHVICSDLAEHRRRVESRAPPTPPLPAPTWEETAHREFEPWTEPVLVVDTTRPIEEIVNQIGEYVRHGSRPA
ncbi:MAG TPA: AAA family ATPase [Thermoplasmata archaeon]|nr:AAA family ATPase [Thermoplasmata archaeon]